MKSIFSYYKCKSDNFNTEELQELREAFRIFDSTGKGKIIPGEIIKEMESTKLNEKFSLIYTILNEMNSENELNFEQFAENCFLVLEGRNGIQALFETLDFDKSVFYIRRDNQKTKGRIRKNGFNTCYTRKRASFG